ncbi:MAG: hypothetical protein H6839_13575 [Planctomycetes bacterium]|nr:hypothetical protein [Planctomycetota bacterium]
MTEQAPKPVSEVPLLSAQPAPRRGNNLLLLFMLACLTALVTGGVLYWIGINRVPPDPHVTQWPQDIPPDNFHMPRSKSDYDAALAHMQVLADAMVEYHDGSSGGGVRWPSALDELQMSGLLAQDYDLRGLLSGEPIVYQPQMPIGHDPERWVMCYDVEIGWHRQPTTGYAINGPIAAAVILGDGTVKLIEGEDLEKYGGLNFQVGATR